MADLWESYLQRGSLGGVEIPISRRRMRMSYDFARKRRPFVDGQDVEDLGEGPRVVSITVPLFEGMNEADLYPQRYEELVSAIRAPENKGRLEYVDPVWGPMRMKVVSVDDEATSEERNGVLLQIDLEEVNPDGEGASFNVTVLTPAMEAANEAAEFDALIEELAGDDDVTGAWNDAGVGVQSTESSSSGSRFMKSVSSFQDGLSDGMRRADQIEAKINVQRTRIQAVLDLPALRTARGWGALAQGTRLLDAVVRAGERALATPGARLISYRTTRPMSYFEVALELYGDRRRAEEVLRNNPQARPLFIPAGQVLRLLDR